MANGREFKRVLKEGTIAGLKKGWSGFIWMMKIALCIMAVS